MAITARVFFKILLMVFFGRTEINERGDLDGYWPRKAFLQPGNRPFDHGLVVFIGIVYACPVLRSGVPSLPVDRNRVDGRVV